MLSSVFVFKTKVVKLIKLVETCNYSEWVLFIHSPKM